MNTSAPATPQNVIDILRLEKGITLEELGLLTRITVGRVADCIHAFERFTIPELIRLGAVLGADHHAWVGASDGS